MEHFGCFHFGDQPLDWFQSEEYCYRKNHSRLIEIKNETKNIAINGIQQVLQRRFWLGATDQVEVSIITNNSKSIGFY